MDYRLKIPFYSARKSEAYIKVENIEEAKKLREELLSGNLFELTRRLENEQAIKEEDVDTVKIEGDITIEPIFTEYGAMPTRVIENNGLKSFLLGKDWEDKEYYWREPGADSPIGEIHEEGARWFMGYSGKRAKLKETTFRHSEGWRLTELFDMLYVLHQTSKIYNKGTIGAATQDDIVSKFTSDEKAVAIKQDMTQIITSILALLNDSASERV